MRILTFLLAILFVIGIGFSASEAQTTTPSRVAYNYGSGKGKVAKVKKHRKAMRYGFVSSKKKRVSRTQVIETKDAKLVIAGDSYEIACNPGDTKKVDLSVMKTDGTQLDAKLSGDYSKSQFATAVYETIDRQLVVQCGFPGVRYFGVESPDFPSLYKVVVVKVSKVFVTELQVDTNTLTLGGTITTGVFKITGKDVDGNTLALARLKATSDNPNVLVSFPDANNPMSLTVTSTKPLEATQAVITVIAMDGEKDCQPLELTVSVDPAANPSTTNTAPSTSNVPTPDPSQAATPSATPNQTQSTPVAKPTASPEASTTPKATPAPKVSPKSTATPASSTVDKIG